MGVLIPLWVGKISLPYVKLLFLSILTLYTVEFTNTPAYGATSSFSNIRIVTAKSQRPHQHLSDLTNTPAYGATSFSNTRIITATSQQPHQHLSDLTNTPASPSPIFHRNISATSPTRLPAYGGHLLLKHPPICSRTAPPSIVHRSPITLPDFIF
jgi:hypothetical protein